MPEHQFKYHSFPPPGTGNLLISEPQAGDNGQYQCFANNELDTAVSPHVFLLNSRRYTFSNNGEEGNFKVGGAED